MTIGPLPTVVRELRRAAVLQQAAVRSDTELLEWFVASGEEAAFEALVRRHGPMVLGLCKRILKHTQDAEDAFQATFVVLMRRASSIVKREMLASWLYGVAYRIALRARSVSARRRGQEREYLEEMCVKPQPEEPDRDLAALLDQEVNRLPAKYRTPLVLCELQGRSRKDAAAELGLNEGTLSSRLARARDLIRKRLVRRGITVSAGGLAAVLSPAVATAEVPTTLLSATVKVALSGTGVAAGGLVSAKVAWLAHKAIEGLFLARLKVGLVLVLGFGMLSAAVGGLLVASRSTETPVAVALASASRPSTPRLTDHPTAHPLDPMQAPGDDEDDDPDPGVVSLPNHEEHGTPRTPTAYRKLGCFGSPFRAPACVTHLHAFAPGSHHAWPFATAHPPLIASAFKPRCGMSGFMTPIVR
jgi:RNA polymerase sigma factor (sigma-70 family)